MDMEETRQQYLANLALIVFEEGLTAEQSTQLMFGEIASWLMVIATLLERENTPS